MKRILNIFSIICIVGASVFCSNSNSSGGGSDGQKPVNANVVSMTVNGTVVPSGGKLSGVSPEDVNVSVEFSEPITSSLFNDAVYFSSGVGADFTILESENPNVLALHLNAKLKYLTKYSLSVSEGEFLGFNITKSASCTIITAVDETPKFDEISDEELLTLVQRRTFAYFWDYGHPVSGLARERNGSDDMVTIGGSGFGIMTIPVAVERGFITRDEGVARLSKILTFLSETASRFHGAFPHWLSGSTGEVVSFSTYDDGADLVETAFLIQGLLTVREYFDAETAAEQEIREKITDIWESVEWSWFTKDGTENALYWHWSPNYDWKMNMQITGWNEALIIYILAASSPTYPITREVYSTGWAQNGGIVNGKSYYGVTLPLGEAYCGPLFFSHYSFLGLDPRGLSDEYADYWEQNVAHSNINYLYCVDNPKGWYGYGENCWGLTASDIEDGYTASAPTNDVGTIAPTAALSSFPYTPAESMVALKYFYYILGDKLFGEYGFYDAFCLDNRWFASSFLAIDQGPIVVMIENYRTGLLWKCFMQCAEVHNGLSNLGFTINQ